jgi:hypothetical protein
MRRQFADVLQRQIAVAPQNHRAQVATAAKNMREVRPAQAALVQQVLDDVSAFEFRPADVLRVVIFNERAKQIEIIPLHWIGFRVVVAGLVTLRNAL